MNRINQLTAFFCCQFILAFGMATPPTQAQTVVDTLPVPPQLNLQNEVFVPRDLDFRVPQSPIAQKADSYLVYINDADSTLLEQVRQTIPTAFRRQHQGKFVIQAGVFSNQENAVTLAQNLQSLGIVPHLFNLTTTKEIALATGKSPFYSVVVPTNGENLSRVER